MEDQQNILITGSKGKEILRLKDNIELKRNFIILLPSSTSACKFDVEVKSFTGEVLFKHAFFGNSEKYETTPINFAEWLSENEWRKKNHTHPKNIGKYWSDLFCEYKTIDELFNLFKEKKTT